MCCIAYTAWYVELLWFWQGGKPSPFDRNLATKLGAKAVEKLIQQIEESKTPTGIWLIFVIYIEFLCVVACTTVFVNVTVFLKCHFLFSHLFANFNNFSQIYHTLQLL